MQTNKDHGVKKKAQAALKSLFGRKKTPAGGGPPGSRASVQGCSPIADAEQKPPASSEPATTSANALVGPPGHPSAVAGNGTSGTDNAVQPSSFDSLPRVARQTRCRLELNEAIDEFRKNYVQFSKANREYILIDDELENVLPDIAAVDVKDIAKTFERNVTRTMRITERKKLLTENHWPTQVGHFLTKLYPVAKLSCSLMGAVAEGAGFSPLKGAASGLGVILQLLGEESVRSDDFILELRRVEDQAALLADGPQYCSNLESIQILLNEKSTDLLTATIVFLNSALLYFSKGFFGNLSNTVVHGADIYETGKTQLRNAIRQYDQVMMHFTARAVAKLNSEQEKHHNIEFLDWLAGQSYWLIESQLSSFRQQRSDGTLEWARNMPEFQAWRLSDLVDGPERRITWIKGSLGLGKSVMAAYFIDLLKCQYRNAVVAYFFCRSKQPGLTSARDILRTLAYQCADNNEAARETLQNLKSEGFQINDNLGIGFLFEKLLLDPLKSAQDIYIVLDGLDEADDETCDHTDPAGRPELHVLLGCLARIPSIRLLCISRPSAQIKAIIPNVFEKTVSKSDNVDDIDSYVLAEVGKSPTLRALFKQDPVQYFRKHGEGVFLWVKLVLQQLAKAKTASAFQKYLDGFSAAHDVITDKLENLYYTILSRIGEDDKAWVNEIIRWLFVAKTQLSIDTLQALAEWCLQDEMITFHQFLDETCGSLLHFLPHPEGEGDLVELVHESFKSFITNPTVCPPSFLIDTPEAECYAALQSLKCLTNHATAPNEVSDYSSSHWIGHLSMASAIQSRASVLVALYSFLASDGTKFWIKRCCESDQRRFYFDFSISGGLPLRDIRQWARDCPIRMDEAGTDHPDLKCALNWQRACLDNSSFLEEIIGKAAVSVWLSEALDGGDAVINCFILGLNYYWRRANRTQSNLEELVELTATNFQSLSAWAEPAGPSVPVCQRNLGLAFYAVYEFDKSLQYLRGDNSIDGVDETLLPYIVACLFVTRQYDSIIEAFDSKHCDISRDVFRAYKKKRAYNRAIGIFQSAYERDPHSDVSWWALMSAYEAQGDVDKMIEISKLALANELLGSLWSVYRACQLSGNYEEAIRAFEAWIDKYPKNVNGWHLLARSCAAADDYDRAIDKLELGLLEIPRDIGLSRVLVEVLIERGDYAEAPQRLRRGIEKGQLHIGTAVSGIVKVYHKLGDPEGLVAQLKPIANRYPFDTEVLHCLCQAYIEAGEYEEAIGISKRAIDNWVVGSYSYDLVLVIYDLCAACNASGDRTTLMQVFESKANVANIQSSCPPFLGFTVLDLHYANQVSAGTKEVLHAIVRPDHIWGWAALLRATARDNDFDAIVERMERLVDDGQMEASCEVAYELMNAYCARGEYNKAIAKLTKIAHAHPLVRWPWHILGEAYARMGNWEEAIKVCESAIRRFPTDYLLYQRVANIHLSTSNYHQAIECYEMIQEIFDDYELLALYASVLPSSIPIDATFREKLLWYPISEAHKRLGEYEKAQRIYDSVGELYQQAIRDRENWSCIFLSHEMPTKSFLKFGVNERVRFGRLPEYALLCAIGELYRAKQDPGTALEAFRTAERVLPPNIYLQHVIVELEEKLGEMATNDIELRRSLEDSSVV